MPVVAVSLRGTMASPFSPVRGALKGPNICCCCVMQLAMLRPGSRAYTSECFGSMFNEFLAVVKLWSTGIRVL